MDVFWCWFSCLWITLFIKTSQGEIGSYKRRNFTSHEHRLMKQLFKRYDAAVRPRYNSSHTVDVTVRFSLQQINDLDEKRQILKISGWITAEWVDEYLQWSPEEYGGLRSLVLSPQRMWVPKLAIGNSANKLFDGEHYKRFWITVRHNGAARWQPGGVFAIACALDMNFYPFDDQKCTMEIETWVYTADKVNLSSSMDVVGVDTYIPHGEWSIIKTEVRGVNVIYRYYLDESFPEVYCTIYMRRKHTFYFMYILLPCLMLSGVLLMIFLLPADSGEKVSLGVSILVAISVFLLLVAGNVPDTSDAIPIIAIYLTYFMMITTLAVAASVIVIMLHFKSIEIIPPQWLRVFIFRYLSRAVCIDNNRKFSSIVAKPRAPPRRETTMTWSETATATEEIRSQNSRTLTPDGPDSYELFQHRIHRRSTATEDNNIDHEMHCLSGLRHHHDHSGSVRSPTVETRYMNEDTPLNGMDQVPEPKNEWKQMAEVMDRFFFLLFLFFLIVPTACILGVVRLFKPEL